MTICAHLVGLVLALGQRHAYVEHVRATRDLVLGDDQQAVVVVCQQQLLGLARALCVDALSDQRRPRVLDQRRRRDHRAHVGWAARRARLWDRALDALGDRADVVRRGAAAAADDADSIAVDEFPKHVGERAGLFREDRLAVGTLDREPGVRDAVHGYRAEFAQEADRVAHVLRAGGAVEPDRVDLQRLERRQRGADVGPQEHLAALRQQRDAALDRDHAVELGERAAGAEHGGLELEDVLARLDDHQIDAACDQAGGLLREHIHELGKRDPAERRVVARGEEAGRAHRTGDEPLLAGGLAGDLCGLEVDLVRVLVEAPLGELQARGLERVGLEHVGASLEHRCVDAFDHVGPVEHQRLVAAARQPVIVFEAELELLERGAHPAVVDNRALVGCGEEVTHRAHATKP